MTHLNFRTLQLVFWWRRWWPLVQDIGPYPSSGSNRGKVYRRRWVIGPVEVRWWA